MDQGIRTQRRSGRRIRADKAGANEDRHDGRSAAKRIGCQAGCGKSFGWATSAGILSPTRKRGKQGTTGDMDAIPRLRVGLSPTLVCTSRKICHPRERGGARRGRYASNPPIPKPGYIYWSSSTERAEVS